MKTQQIKVPSVGESVTEATIGEWQKKDGDYIQQNDVLVVMETDKASMDLVAEQSGQLKILKPEGEDVKIGEVIAEVDTSAKPQASVVTSSKPRDGFSEESENKTKEMPKETPSPLAHQQEHSVVTTNQQDMSLVKRTSPLGPEEHQFPTDQKLIDELLKSPFLNKNSKASDTGGDWKASSLNKELSPAVRRLISERHIDPSNIKGTGPRGRITKGDVLTFIKNLQSIDTAVNKVAPAPSSVSAVAGKAPDYIPSVSALNNGQTKKKMSTIRKRIAERLVESQQSTATLTTFNEIDMSEVINLRSQYKESFQKKHNIKLGFMGFFIKAVVQALKTFPRVNAFIEGDYIVYNHACHVGVAVSTERGLVVPVIRHADTMEIPEIEKAVLFYAEKARDGKIQPDDLMGGTFTISNGGVFGSLMSTPILNPPQSGILGMHRIEQRPIAVDGQVKIKPMMYVALSYDHRMVDGKESVGFLLKIKECVEDPVRLFLKV